MCTREGVPQLDVRPSPAKHCPFVHALCPPVFAPRAHSVPVRADNYGQQRCDPTRTATRTQAICARQSHTSHPSAVASQAESASSILVTRSMEKAQVSDLGRFCWAGPVRPVRTESCPAAPRAPRRCRVSASSRVAPPSRPRPSGYRLGIEAGAGEGVLRRRHRRRSGAPENSRDVAHKYVPELAAGRDSLVSAPHTAALPTPR
jgi:hypothetical protein